MVVQTRLCTIRKRALWGQTRFIRGGYSSLFRSGTTNPSQLSPCEANTAVPARRHRMDFRAYIGKLALGAFAVSSFLAGGGSSAQVVTGTLGEASATTTIKGNQIPAPAPPFGGVIKENAAASTTWWPPRVVPP